MILKLKYILFCFALIILTNSYGQFQKKIDSLQILIKTTPDDSNKVNSLYTLGRYYEYFNSKERIDYFIAALNLAKKINDKNEIKKLSSALVTNLFHRKMYDVSMYYCLEYLNFLEKEGLKDDILTTYNVYGNLLAKQGKHEEALKYYHLAKNYYSQKNELGGYANTLNNLSILLIDMGQLDSALQYSLKASEIFKAHDGGSAYANSVLGVSEIHLQKGDLISAKKEASFSLELYSNKVKDPHGIANCLLVLGEIYLADHKPDSALASFKKAMNYINSLNYIHLKKECAKFLAETYSNLKNYQEAYNYQIKFQLYNDTIALNNLKGKMLEMEVKYDITKKESELKQKNFELIAKNKQKNYLIIIIVVVLILFGISYNAYSQKRKANTLISEQKKLVDEKQKEILDSIRYAKRIQTALITNEKYIDKNLNRLMKD